MIPITKGTYRDLKVGDYCLIIVINRGIYLDRIAKEEFYHSRPVLKKITGTMPLFVEKPKSPKNSRKRVLYFSKYRKVVPLRMRYATSFAPGVQVFLLNKKEEVELNVLDKMGAIDASVAYHYLKTTKGVREHIKNHLKTLM